MRTTHEAAAGCEERAPCGARSPPWLRRRQHDPISHRYRTAGRDDLPDGAVDLRERRRAGLDRKVAHVTPVPIVVLGVRRHGEAERVGGGAEEELDGPAGKVGAVHAKGVLDERLDNRMRMRAEREQQRDGWYHAS